MLFPNVPRLAVTATADLKTQADIRLQLKLENARTFVASFDRPNLALSAERKATRRSASSIYAASAKARPASSMRARATPREQDRRRAAETAGLRAFAYHAGLDANLRQKRQHTFQTKTMW
jgi:ATP-dependent DNA helicase RecQ